MKYYLIAGEASGDLHGSNLMKALREKDPDAVFRFFGGDLMLAAGGTLVKHYREMAFMGFFDIVANLRTINRNLKVCKNDIQEYRPDAVILIDYPGFNLRIAEYAFIKGFRVFYYISPKVWASRESRVEKIRKYVHRLFVIFPFEVEYFMKHGIEVEYSGNPLMDSLEEYRNSHTDPESFRAGISPEKRPVVALLAGSRKYEVLRCLPEMVKAVSHFPGYQFVVAGVNSLDPSIYQKILEGSDVKIIYNRTYDLLQISYAAIVTSGTATLETALFMVPQVVIYKIGHLTYRLGKFFVNIRFFSLVNIIAGREIVKELLQFNLAADIILEMDRILHDNDYRMKMTEGYRQVGLLLGKGGTSKRIAARICEMSAIK